MTLLRKFNFTKYFYILSHYVQIWNLNVVEDILM